MGYENFWLDEVVGGSEKEIGCINKIWGWFEGYSKIVYGVKI